MWSGAVASCGCEIWDGMAAVSDRKDSSKRFSQEMTDSVGVAGAGGVLATDVYHVRAGGG